MKLTQLVYQNKGMFGGVAEDSGGFAQFHEEGALARHDVVVRSETSENPIHRSELAFFGRDMTALNNTQDFSVTCSVILSHDQIRNRLEITMQKELFFNFVWLTMVEFQGEESLLPCVP